MKVRICGLHLLLLVLLIRNSGSKHEVKDEKGRQTFVVRYKSGEQTIPVTVVLDYKKQTEYVINMNPRTPAKSVTLYDFKQRTIAYKDLTNQECFLGHLTHETLNHESDALRDIKSPVESTPKVLSLDPRSPALTPTEIRNIAGQKTAAFCRKMNTWLLKPIQTHSVKKREVDEIEERIYGHHGFHTVQYSHYGHETRRRYRNPGRLHSRHESQKNQTAAVNRNGKPVFPKPSQTLHEIHKIQPTYNLQYSSNNNDESHHRQLENGSDNHQQTYDPMRSSSLFEGLLIPSQNNIDDERPYIHHKKKEHSANKDNNLPSKFLATRSNKENAENFHTEHRNYSPVSPGNINTNFAYKIRSPNHFEADFSSSFGDKTDDISNSLELNSHRNIYHKPTEKRHEFHHSSPEVNENGNSLSRPSFNNFPNINADNSLPEHAKRTERDSSNGHFPVPSYYRNQGYKRESLYPSSNPNSNKNIETHIPLYKPETHKPNFYSQDQHALTENKRLSQGIYDSVNRPINSNIETESLSTDLHSSDNETSRGRFENRVNNFEVPQNPDVSVNVLEIPRFTHKFENLTSERIPSASMPRNEGIHNVLGGFYDSKENHPVLEHDYFYNPYARHNAPNFNENTFHSRNSQPLAPISVPQSTEHIASKNSEHSVFSSYSPSRPVINLTDFPDFATVAYGEVHQALSTSNPQNLGTLHTPQPNYVKSEDQSTLNKFFHKKNSLPPNRLESVANVLPQGHFPVQGSNFYDDNSLGLIPDTFLTTQTPITTHHNHYANSNHRSDTPSENGDDETSPQTVTPISAEVSPNKFHPQFPVPNNSRNEGFPHHQIRFQNVLRHFKPDEIVIDIENIPTPQTTESTSDFHHRRIVTNEPTPPPTESTSVFHQRRIIVNMPTPQSTETASGFHQRRIVANVPIPRSAESTAGFHQRRIVANQTPLNPNETNTRIDRRHEQISGTTWRSSHVETTRHPRRRIHNKLNKNVQNGVSFHVRKNSMARHHPFNNTHGIPQHQVNRQSQIHSGYQPSQLHQFHPRQFESPHQLNDLQQFNQYNNNNNRKLHVLPPGVSMHPRHPQAPYADMVHSNSPPNISQQNINHALFQPHRQRHHRKKERQSNSCCRMIGKPSALLACCRSGGHCCSSPHTRMHQQRTPCCSSNKIAQNKRVFSASTNQLPARTEFRPQETRRTIVDNRNQCQKEKMCRTLYETTQQVMVCRSANIKGC